MSLNLLDLIKQVRKNTRVIGHHVGIGGNAHPTVNDFNSGFMSPDQKATLETASSDAKNGRGLMQRMPNGTDVLTLPAGNYIITNALNNPIGPDDFSITLYHISDSGDSRREIRAVVSSTGSVYTRTVHTGGDPTSGSRVWDQQTTRHLVWSGEASSGTINFDSEILGRHAVVEIFYETISGQQSSIRLYRDYASGNINETNHPNDLDSLTVQAYELRFTANSTSLTINNNVIRNINNSSVNVQDTPGVSIIAVYWY